MKEELAEQLLGRVLEWDTPTAKVEIAQLRYFAAVKYDGYRNFQPGHRFMESLVLWLRNFETIEERRIAYDFVKNRMLYISESQMDHLVSLLYPQRILPILLDQARQIEKLEKYHMRKIRYSRSFEILQRKSLFLGMSDGARMDAFRRKNALSNDQVFVSFELSDDRLQQLHMDLKKWLDAKDFHSCAQFENIFLVDDFSGSGNSALKEECGILKGKLMRFFVEFLGEDKKLGKFYESDGPNVFIVHYVATEKAVRSLRANVKKLPIRVTNREVRLFEVLDPIQLISDKTMIPQPGSVCDGDFDKLLFKYYDPRLHDEHTATGGPDVIHGYAGCALPLVLSHNCPNNSVYLLWGTTPPSDQGQGLNALFPRVSRHLEGR